MKKITIIGAGAVGATCAQEIARKNLAEEIVLLDVKEGVAEGKALDMYQASTALGENAIVRGVTNNYAATKGSGIVVITSGIPRKPGMTREELIGTNAKIIEEVVKKSIAYSPNTIFIVVSNPVDTLALLAVKVLGGAKAKHRVVGLGGALDSSRFKAYLSLALGCPPKDIQGMVIGGHGDTTMIPLIKKAYLQGVPVTSLLDKKKCDEIVKKTMVGGATLTSLIGTSAWYAPGAAVASMAESITHNQKRVIPCSVYLSGEYGEKDMFMGAPVVLGSKGVEKIIELDLSASEKAAYKKSAIAVRETNKLLK